MNIFLWFLCLHEVWADIATPRPHFQQEYLPPPELPPYIFPWPEVWIIAPIILIVVALFILIRYKRSPKETKSPDQQDS